MDDLARMLSGYLECALWSSTDADCEPLDKNYGLDNIDPEACLAALVDCKSFLEKCDKLGVEWWNDTHPTRGHTLAEALGNDFWLTRNRNGAGFWDGDWLLADALDEIAKSFPETNLYIGDDGALHLY